LQKTLTTYSFELVLVFSCRLS